VTPNILNPGRWSKVLKRLPVSGIFPLLLHDEVKPQAQSSQLSDAITNLLERKYEYTHVYRYIFNARFYKDTHSCNVSNNRDVTLVSPLREWALF
jgi:hypothetical protein